MATTCMASAVPHMLPPLKDLCVQVVSANFDRRPTLNNLPEQLVKRVTEGLPLDLPLELVGRVRAAYGAAGSTSQARCTRGVPCINMPACRYMCALLMCAVLFACN